MPCRLLEVPKAGRFVMTNAGDAPKLEKQSQQLNSQK
jgi:hypothetical protein